MPKTKNQFTSLSRVNVHGAPLVALFVALTFTARAAEQPNVVFVLTDQWRASAFGFAGDPNVKTPQIDKLARQSIRFDNAVSVCPVCTPCRAALLTGRFPTSTGMFLNDLYLPDRELCMAEIFKSAGYDTAYIGKWHLDGHGRSSYIPPERRQGFDYWKTAECDHNYNHSHYYTAESTEKQYWPGYDAFAQTADAQQYLRERKTSKNPFLLFIAYGSPHFPHVTAPQEYKALYPPEKIKLPPNVPDNQVSIARKELNGYYAHCTALDKCVGDLLATLQETGLDGQTLVVFTSDHGEMMGAHGIKPIMKQWPYDESTRVPFLLRDPRAKAHLVTSPLGTTDILPTLLGLTGIAVPKTVEGEDLSAIVTADGTGTDRAALMMSVSPFAPGLRAYRGIRTNRYTYVRDLKGPWLMFDNQADPHQMNNLSGDPAHGELQKKLEAQLQGELKKIGDTFQPRQFYLDKFGYELGSGGFISYAPDAKVQSPRPQSNQK